MDMDIDEYGIDFIKSFEGFEAQAYQCPGKVWTIGHGLTGTIVLDGVDIPIDGRLKLGYDLLEAAFRDRLSHYVAAVNAALQVNVSQCQFNALVSITYNIGIAAMRKSTFMRRLNLSNPFDENDTNFIAAVEAMGWWNKVNGDVVNGLTRRRTAEQRMMVQVPELERHKNAYEGDVVEPGASAISD